MYRINVQLVANYAAGESMNTNNIQIGRSKSFGTSSLSHPTTSVSELQVQVANV